MGLASDRPVNVIIFAERNILWFNPLFSSNVKTNIGKIFLRLLDKHFPKYHKYYKLFNRNNVKISYSCMQNMASVFQNHKTNLLKDLVALTAKEFSCWQKSNFPLAEKCLSELVYHAQVNRSDINQTKNVKPNQTIMVLAKKNSRGVIKTIRLLLEIKVKKKEQNPQNIYESWKIAA